MSARTTGQSSLIAFVCVVVIAGESTSFAQNPPIHTRNTKANRNVLGAQFCIPCHEKGNGNDLCRMIESHIWEKQDPHKKAMDWGKRGNTKEFGGFESPAGQRAAEIGDRLKIKDVTKDKQCIGCHSVPVVEGRSQFFDNPMTEGVTCVACHGAYQEWGLQHQLPGGVGWKGLTRAQKWEDFGMVDLWDPVVRAQTCMSCHIGDPKADKTITHAMYAAGHPSLPSIEVTAFCEEQPQHWLYLRCKNAKAQERLKFNTDRLEQTEQVVVGGLVALTRTMELFEAEAKKQKEQPGWPEFARFDCSACHHELKASGVKNWRQQDRGYGVGRPSAPAWPKALVYLGLDAADPTQFKVRSDELDARLAEFHAALTVRPFGDPNEIVKKAKAIIDLTEKPLVELSRLAAVEPGTKGRVLNQAEALRLLQRLVEIGHTNLKDYESARQIGWAFRIIDHELWEVTKVRPGRDKALELLAKNQSRIQEILKGLDADLVLSLRDRGSVAMGECPPPNLLIPFPNMPDQKPIIGPILEARLRKLADYEPDSFRSRFDELFRLVPAP